MDYESEDVILTPFASDEIIYVTRPVFYLRHSHDISVTSFGIKIHLLAAKCQFSHSSSRTAEYEVHHGTVLRLYQTFIRVFNATCSKIFCHTVR